MHAPFLRRYVLVNKEGMCLANKAGYWDKVAYMYVAPLFAQLN